MILRILIVDDEEKLRGLLAKILTLEGFVVEQARDCKSALKKLGLSWFDVVVCDVKMPDGNGVDFVKEIKAKYPNIEIILLTAFGNIPDCVTAIKNGAFEYLTKGDDNNRIIPMVYRALEKSGLNRKVANLERQLDERRSFEGILGVSKSLASAVESAKRVAVTDTTVLLTGETGTGKEVFAHAIHLGSRRCKQAFIAVNCAAFSKELLESELFGHKAGAFTGALKETKGIFEEAHKGTVFLDEIGEMPIDLQSRLLRVLESGEIMKVGDSKALKVDVRLIAATNRDLGGEIANGRFREDLFYRISVFNIELPPLRDRQSDIEPLANHFLALFGSKMGRGGLSFSGEYLALLKKHNWKGNVRELRNVVERSVILTDGAELGSDSLPEEIRRLSGGVEPGKKQLSAFDLGSVEKLHIQKVLNYTNGNKAETARLLNVAISTLYRKLEEYRINYEL